MADYQLSRRRFLGGAAAGGAILLGGSTVVAGPCGDDDDGSTTPTTTTAAATTTTAAATTTTAMAMQSVNLQMSWLDSVQFGGSYIADERGYYERFGLDVTLLPGGPGVPVDRWSSVATPC